MAMHQYLCSFSIDGKRTEQIVSANGMLEAKKIIEAQYKGCRITWWNVKRV